MKKIDKKIELLKRQQEELGRRTEAENKAIELISQCKFEEAREVLASMDDSVLEETARELDALEKEERKESSGNASDEPMELELESIGNKNFLLLDGKRIHHVEKYTITNRFGMAKLSIKMWVKFSDRT